MNKPSETAQCCPSPAMIFGTAIKCTSGDVGPSAPVCDIVCVRPYKPELTKSCLTSIFASETEIERGKEEEITKAGDPKTMILPPRASIPVYFFKLTPGVQHVTVGSSCQALWMYAFAGSRIQSIDIPDTVTLIDAHCFEKCYKLQSVHMSHARSRLRRIGDSAFLRCSALRSFIVPDSLEEIGAKCFWMCYCLRQFTISMHGQKLRKIGTSAFFGSRLESFYIPETLVDLPEQLCEYCPNMRRCFFAYDVTFTMLPNLMFLSCQSLMTINIPDSVVVIGTQCFAGCSRLFAVSFGSNSRLQRILPGAFSDTKLEEIDLPDSLEEIGPYAFLRCYRLARVGFGKESKLRTVGIGAFCACRSLTYLDDVPEKFRKALTESN